MSKIDEMPLIQKRLAETMMTLPGMTIERSSAAVIRLLMQALPTAISKRGEPLLDHVRGRLREGQVQYYQRRLTCS